MEEFLVSVIIPAYNHEKYIQKTIKSIINQTYKNIELIIIDDGSSDSTWQKMQEIKPMCDERFARVHFETKPNEGVTKTLNRLVSLINGRYVFMIASDDLAKPEAIEKEIGFLAANPDYYLAVGNDDIIDGSGIICYWDKKRNTVYDKNKAEYTTFVDFLKKNRNFFNDKDFGTYRSIFGGNYIPNGFTLKKEVFDKIGQYPDGILEDWWMMLQISKYYKMKYLDEVLYSYRWHSNISIKKSRNMSQIEKNTLNWELSFLKNADKTEFRQEIYDTINLPVILKQRGIPFLYEEIKMRRYNKQQKIIKIFGITAYSFEKDL